MINSTASIWKGLFEKEGIPLVDRKDHNYREEFLTLRPLVTSRRAIGRYLGRAIGTVPKIREDVYNKIKNDIQEPKKFGKELYKRGWKILVYFPTIVRTVNAETPLALDPVSQDLIVVQDAASVKEEEIEIPFSLKNLKELSRFPLAGKENMPVFHKYSSPEIFNQCNTRPDTVTVYFMRKQVADQSRNQSYVVQKKLVEDEGFEVTSILMRAFNDAIEILERNTCPDNQKPLTIARCSDTVQSPITNNVYQTAIGGFAPGAGVGVYDDFFGNDNLGVAPGGPCGSSAIGT